MGAEIDICVGGLALTFEELRKFRWCENAFVRSSRSSSFLPVNNVIQASPQHRPQPIFLCSTTRFRRCDSAAVESAAIVIQMGSLNVLARSN